MVRQHVPILSVITILCIIMFITGLALGVVLFGQGPADVLEASELAIESAALEQLLFSEYTPEHCSSLSERQREQAQILARVGRELSEGEQAGAFSSREFDVLKKRYHLMQIRSYLQLHKLSINCEEEYLTIIFFYEGLGGDERAINNSLEQGLILDEIVDFLGEDVVSVYAIERSYADELLFIEEFYDVTYAPSLVINFDKVIEGLRSEDEVLEVLGYDGS